MRIVVFRSRPSEGDKQREGRYSQRSDTRYAGRVIGNLTGGDGFCTACGPDCIFCRRPYGRRFEEHVAGVIDFPAVLPFVLEHPAEYVPRDVPAHDILIAVCIHEQILVECLKACRQWGARGVVVPIEAPDWIHGAAISDAERICRRSGIEIAFPKPFCSLRPPKGSFLAEFRETFHVGFPEVEITVEKDIIQKAEVKVSAPCGATYYIAKWLVGRSLPEDLKHDVIAKRLHSYPCTASMEWDRELGDTILHVGGQNHYTILGPLDKAAEEERDVVLSPLGTVLPKPVPPAENLTQIENAKEAILKELETKAEIPLTELRRKKLAPATLSSALIILKQQGRIKLEGRRILKA